MHDARRGREKLHFLNAAPINAIADRWINHYDRPRAEALADLKTALEQNPVTKPPTGTEFVYTTYIKTTPEQLWQALTDPAFTIRYWGVELMLRLEGRLGDHVAVQGRDDGRPRPDRAGRGREPPARVQLARDHAGVRRDSSACSPAEVAAFAAEQRSNVTFEIEPIGDLVKLTVTHGGFEPRQRVARRYVAGLADHPRQPEVAAGDRRSVDVRMTAVVTTR